VTLASAESQTSVTSAQASDAELLLSCDVQTYRASGPGGQNRNKVETAVRLRHRPSGITVTATESRSQAENKARAIRRMRTALALRVRHPIEGDAVPAAIAAIIGKDGRLSVGRRDQRYLPAASQILDLLLANEGSVRETAGAAGVTSANLSGFLTGDDDVMAEANRIRAQLKLKPLRRS
jgi:hypothetical protein